jgi:hypothetical protein
LLATNVGPTVALVGTTNPTVKAGHHDSPIAVPGGSYATMASLSLPAGAWFVTAKAVLAGTASSYAHYGVTCRLIAGADFDTVAGAPLQMGVEDQYQPIWLTVVHRFDTSGSAKLRCVAEVPGTVQIRLIKMTALHVGTLINFMLGGGGSSSGSGAPRVISGWRDSSTSVPANTPTDLGQLTLAAGRWWVQAKAILGGGASSSAIVDCALIATDASVGVEEFVTTKIGVASSFLAGDRASLGTQLVANFNQNSSNVRLRCTSGNAFQYSWVKITAVDLGKVTYKPLAGGTSQTFGSGTPRVIYGSDPGAAVLNASSDYTTVRSLSLPAGNWSVSASVWAHAGGSSQRSLVRCLLVLGSDQGASRVRLAGGNIASDNALYLQVNQSIASASSVRLRCKRDNSNVAVTLNHIWIVALKAGTFSDVSL